MEKLVFWTFLLLALTGGTLCAQPSGRFLRATSGNVKILDGDDLLDGVLVPALKPDVYTYHPSPYARRLVFYTNIDSLELWVQPGETKDFAVVLNGKDTCYQRFSGTNPRAVTYLRPPGRAAASNDTVPFRLGPDNMVHVQGRLNGSEPLDLMFDTGASLGVLNENGQKKGAKLDPNNQNNFEFAGITVKGSPAVFIDYHGGAKVDGIIGFNAFEGKVLEINYDKSILVIHHAPWQNREGYRLLEMHWRGANMMIEGEINTGRTRSKGLFLFDCGSKWALSLEQGFCKQQRLYGLMKSVGTRWAHTAKGVRTTSETVIAPQLSLAGFSLPDVPVDLEEPRQQGEGLERNILGNDVLKRFNAVIDYANGVVYVKPNSLTTLPYNKSWDLKKVVLFGLLGVAFLAVVVGLWVRHRRRKPRPSR